MKRKEAIQMLRLYEVNDAGEGELETWYNGIDKDMREAIDMAIEALSANRPTGEWIDKGEYAECSICGGHSGTQFDGVEPIPLKTNFCPNCGAIMKGAGDETD